MRPGAVGSREDPDRPGCGGGERHGRRPISRLLRLGVADLGPDAPRDGVAGIFVEAARLIALDAVADAELLEFATDCGDALPVEVLEPDVVWHADVPAELALGKAHEGAVDRLDLRPCLSA